MKPDIIKTAIWGNEKIWMIYLETAAEDQDKNRKVEVEVERGS